VLAASTNSILTLPTVPCRHAANKVPPMNLSALFGVRRRILFSALLLLVLIFCGVSRVNREPTLAGRPITSWLAELRDDDQSKREAAFDILRSMDAKTVAFLTQRVATPDSPLRRRISLRHLWVGTPSNGIFASLNFERAMAAAALGAGGEKARSAIPALEEAAKNPSVILSAYAQAALIKFQARSSDSFVNTLTNTAQPIDALRAASVLLALNTNENWIVNQLKTTLDKSSDSNRLEVLEFLCKDQFEPALAWPMIIFALESSWPFKANAVNAAIVQLGSPTLSQNRQRLHNRRCLHA
jgi:hypothetical protein